LQFEGQLKVALHQPRLLGSQRIAIKFRNFIAFYDLILSSRYVSPVMARIVYYAYV
jgi:hypothetical protein